MNTIKTFTLSAITAVTIAGLSVSSVQAEMYQEQSQNSSQSTSFSFNGNGSGEFKSSSKLKQSQSQGTGKFEDNWERSKPKSRHSNRRYNRAANDGTVTLSWDHRGGTCHVRYTEGWAKNGNYNYSTSAACDEGQITIGGLKPGSLYTFQVKKDDGNWSSPMRLKAS